MASESVSAVAAMNSLRVQIEDRLLQNEDYRALRAIERAITDVLSPSSTRINNLSAILNNLVNSAPSPSAQRSA